MKQEDWRNITYAFKIGRIVENCIDNFYLLLDENRATMIIKDSHKDLNCSVYREKHGTGINK